MDRQRLQQRHPMQGTIFFDPVCEVLSSVALTFTKNLSSFASIRVIVNFKFSFTVFTYWLRLPFTQLFFLSISLTISLFLVLFTSQLKCILASNGDMQRRPGYVHLPFFLFSVCSYVCLEAALRDERTRWWLHWCHCCPNWANVLFTRKQTLLSIRTLPSIALTLLTLENAV